MSRPLAFLFLTLIFLTSCRHETKTDLITIDILEGLKTEKELRLSEIVDDVEYVKLETAPECLLPEQSIYLIGKKYILVYQRQEPAWIKLFDRQGHFLRNIGREGKGPLEYLSINALAADPDETFLLVADRNDKLLKFDFQGTVLTQVNYQKSFQGVIAEIEIKSSKEMFLLLDYPILAQRNFCMVREINGDLVQIDSLFPVTSSDMPVKGGYMWGHGDFYLLDGKINFRLYSYDTLYEGYKGKMVPRFYFPITKDHLPGPYIIYGIHKGDYSEVSLVYELPGYLILYVSQASDYYGTMIYDKTSGILSTLPQYPLPPPAKYPQQQLVNDIDGVINPARIYKNISNGFIFYSYEVIELKELVEKDSLGFDQPRFPEKRKEFIGMVTSSKDDDNPILQIFHLK